MLRPNVIFPRQINSCRSILFISFHLNAMIHAVPSHDKTRKDTTHLVSFRLRFLAILGGNIYTGFNESFCQNSGREEIWNCCRIRPPNHSHGLMVKVVTSEGRLSTATDNSNIK